MKFSLQRTISDGNPGRPSASSAVGFEALYRYVVEHVKVPG
jgi:hypothetical protein